MKRITKFLVVALLAIISLSLLYAYIAYTAEYINRVLRWGDSDVYDYQKFPERVLGISDSHFEFPLFPDEERAKSFTSALIGVAISEGYIHSVNDPITDYLPELAKRDPAFANITIRNLLMMSSGIKYVEVPFFHGDNAKIYYYPDLRYLALEDTHIVVSPGEYFLYNNYNPLLLGMIIERATGSSVANYLQEKIWKPIGMEYPGSWSLDEAGFEKMESGINARAIDFAKFGRLFLHNGDWNGTQIVPAEWIAESTQADTPVDYANYYDDDFIFANGRGYYKYMWWGIQRDAQNYDFMALGWVDMFYGFANYDARR